MISILRGNVISQETDGIIVDVNGIGFHVLVPTYFKDRVQSGEAVYIFTRLIIREDAWILCGFDTREGREVFDLVLSVNGVGPRLALSILSTLNPRFDSKGSDQQSSRYIYSRAWDWEKNCPENSSPFTGSASFFRRIWFPFSIE